MALFNGTSGTSTATPPPPAWPDITEKPLTFPPTLHEHDDRYYPQSTLDTALSDKSATTHGHTLSSSAITGPLPVSKGGVPTNGTSGQVLQWEGGVPAWATGGAIYRKPNGFTRNDVQAALDEVGAAGGGVVYCPPGVYTVEDLSVPASTTLLGAGMNATRFNCVAGSTLKMCSTAGMNARIEGITWNHTAGDHPTVHPTDPTVTPNYGGAVTISVAHARCAVVRCEVINPALDGISFMQGANRGWALYNFVRSADRSGIVAAGTSTTPASEMVIHGNHIFDTYASGVMANGACARTVISENTITNTGGSGDGIAAYSLYNQQLSVIGNVCKDTGNNGTHVGGDQALVSGNHFYNPAEHGIYWSNPGTGDFCYGFSASGNTVYNSGREGIAVRWGQDAVISGNSVRTTGESGIDVADSFRVTVSGNTVQNVSTGHGINLLASSDVSVSGNEVHSVSNGDGLYGVARGTVNSLRVKVSGNGFRACSGNGVRATAGCNHWCVVGNTSVSNGGNYNVQGASSLVASNV